MSPLVSQTPWRRLLLMAAFALLAMLPAFSPAQDVIPGGEREPFEIRLLGEEEWTPPRDGPIKILGLDDNPRLKERVEELAYETRSSIRENTRVDWEGTAYIVWVEDEQEYLERTGFRPEFTAAAASARHRSIWINAGAWRRSDPATQQQTLAHEMGHLLVGSLPGGERLPLWAEEGLVMHLADQWDTRQAIAVLRAHAFGQLPRLSEIEETFPREPNAQELAYAVSYAAVAQLSGELGDEPGSVTRLMRRLADEEIGPQLKAELWQARGRSRVQMALEQSLGGRVASVIIIASSGTAIWVLIMVLALLAYAKKRNRRSLRRRQELAEEPWAESLTQRDIEDIYGTPEDSAPASERESDEEYPWEKWERLRAEEDDGGGAWR